MESPIHFGTAPSAFLAIRTTAVMSFSAISSSVRPANWKRSRGFSRPMKLSSTEPSEPPFAYFTCTLPSLVIVPIDSRCRKPTRRSSTR